MSITTEYIESLKFNDRVINGRIEGLNHVDSMRQLPFEGNCLNWNLGHLLVYRAQILGFIDGESAADKDEFAMYGAGSEPLTDSDKAIPFETLKKRLLEMSDTLEKAITDMPASRLDEILDEERGITVRQRVNFYLLFHEPYHIGQLEILQALAQDAR